MTTQETLLEDRRRDNGEFGNKTFSPPTVSLTGPAIPELAGIPVPVCSPENLTHIGSLDPGAKGKWSLEGQGLSVSQHPEAWGRIAQLGGPIWAIGSDTPTFLNFHKLTSKQKKAMVDWGVDLGYVTREPAWRVTTWDDEWEQNRWTVFLDEDEARDEAEETEGTVRKTTAVVATDTFPDQTVKPGTEGVDEILATVWVNDVATDFDGVWWADTYDPDMLSAPRGVIATRAIAEWVGSARAYDGDEDYGSI